MEDVQPAILIISNITYGIYNGIYNNGTYTNKNKNKFLYKCITCFDEILYVPYNPVVKNLNNLNKNNVNYYILVKKSTDCNNIEKQIGQIVETIGKVSDIQAYYRYSYYVIITKYILKLNTLQTLQTLQNSVQISHNEILEEIYTIDPIGSDDLDDAFCIKDSKLYVMISDLTEDFENILKNIKLSSTIYASKVMHMLKDYKKYSLLADNNYKNVLCLEIDLNTKAKKLYNKKIKVFQNLNYSSEHSIINQLINITNDLNKSYDLNKNKNKQFKVFENMEITDSHKAIEYIMILFGIHCADILQKHKCGLFRITENEVFYSKAYYSLEPVINTVFNTWYVHITSPIRRLVDCINMYYINCIINCPNFITDFINNDFVETLNKQQKQIKKLQVQMQLLQLLKDSNNIFKGIIIDYDNEQNKYAVQLQNPRITVEWKSNDVYILGSEHNFQLFLFENKNKFTQKIKLKIVKQ